MSKEARIIENTMQARDAVDPAYGYEELYLSVAEVEAILKGKVVATTIMDEYNVFVAMKER